MLSSSLKKETRVILNRWAKEQFYVYIRPVSSRMIDIRSKHKTYWIVSVEYRTVPPGNWRGEGYNLDDVIADLAKVVPRNRAEYREQTAGWLCPEVAFEAEKRAHRPEKPRKKPKSGKALTHGLKVKQERIPGLDSDTYEPRTKRRKKRK